MSFTESHELMKVRLEYLAHAYLLKITILYIIKRLTLASNICVIWFTSFKHVQSTFG